VDFWETIARRRSIRRFVQDRDVPSEVIERLLEAAIAAPSAGNRQPWHFYVVRDRRIRQKLASAAYGQDFLVQAPVNIVVCAEPERSASRYGERGARLYCLQDTAAATENILLAAVALGLGACWVGAFDEAAAAAALGLRPRQRPVVIVALAYPDETVDRPPRRPLAEVATYL